MCIDKNLEVFLCLLRAGLWEKEVLLLPYGEIDFAYIMKIAEMQGCVGLVAAGLEQVTDMKPPKMDALQFICRVTQMEQRNAAMNNFIGMTVKKMRDAGIYSLLVKGQGVAQCYERPMWRPAGDVDLLLDKENYQKAKKFLLTLSSGNKHEEQYSQHLGLNIGPWYVEIHGTLRTGLSAQVDRMVDSVQSEVFRDRKVRIWKNGETEVYLPAPNHDVFLVFTHFIKHFYKGGITLRQVCDWLRLLWSYNSVLDVALQERWLLQAGLMDEWKAFAAVAVDWLGMPEEAMPFYESQLKNKGSQLVEFILGSHSGNKFRDTWQIANIFPRNTLRYSPSIFLNLNWLKVKERVINR